MALFFFGGGGGGRFVGWRLVLSVLDPKKVLTIYSSLRFQKMCFRRKRGDFSSFSALGAPYRGRAHGKDFQTKNNLHLKTIEKRIEFLSRCGFKKFVLVKNGVVFLIRFWSLVPL